MARSRVYSDEQIMEGLRATKGLVFLAAKKIGCDPDTIYKRSKGSPEIRACIQFERGKIIDTAEEQLFKATQSGEQWAVSFVLKTIGKDRGYVERAELTGKDGDALVQVTEVVVRTREEANRLLPMIEDQTRRNGSK